MIRSHAAPGVSPRAAGIVYGNYCNYRLYPNGLFAQPGAFGSTRRLCKAASRRQVITLA